MEDVRARISSFYKSFSGTDTLAFIMVPGCTPVWLGSLTTISYSMYRNKRPVINIGRTNINGVTRGSRIYAGTMIFTLINQHWLREIQEQENTKWLGEFKDLKVDELPLFDIVIISANEYGNAVSMYIYGIDFTDEAQTISVEDLFTENTFSFVARDVSTFKSLNIFSSLVEKHSPYEKKFEIGQRCYIIDHSNFSFDQLEELEREHKLSAVNFDKMSSKTQRLQRELYYPASNPFMGNDVMEIQQLLNGTKLFSLATNGIYNQETSQAVREYQFSVGLPPTGILNEKTYNSLLNGVKGDELGRLAVVVNKYGAYIYEKPFIGSNIVGIESYQNQVAVLDMVVINDNGVIRRWYKTDRGYIVIEDMYSSYYQGNTLEFPILQFGDISSYVTLIQTALSQIYQNFVTINGEFDATTLAAIKKFQREHGLDDNGIVDYQTWLLLEQYSNKILGQISDDNFNISFSRDPGTYEIKQQSVLNELRQFHVTMSCNNSINVKMTATCIYYHDDSTKNIHTVKAQTYTIKNPQTFNFDSIFRNAFVYDPQIGKTPDVVDIVIYPFNKTPYKWSIRYS